MALKGMKSVGLRRECAVLVFICAMAAMLGNGGAAWAAQSGSIVAWGWNDDGQCNVPSPNSGFVAVAAGAWHNLGLKGDGSIVAWGRNDYGQCNVPSPNSGFVVVAAGAWHCLGLKGDGSIVAWGDNDYGQCNVPSP
ncbi:MAG: hypothetical protein NT106_11680, partial [Candidatus Sumerlaeota bacterium]|nr:hypothetical protein [Candidatus Sumerlaeota bacterium]